MRFPLKPLLAAALLGTASSHAATYHWDGASGTQNDLSDNTTTTGQNWLSDGAWDNGATAGPLASWNSGDSAVFGGSAASQTVTLASGITAGNLTFGSGGDASGTSGTNYTIKGSTIMLGTSTITTNTNATVSSVLATGSLIKAGDGTLTLTGANTYSGATVNAGTLRIGDGTTNGTLGSGTYAIASGSMLRIQYNTSGSTAISNWGAFTGGGTLAIATAKSFDYTYGGNLALTSSFTGTLQIEGGRVYANAASALGGAQAVVVKNGGQLAMWNGGSFSQNFIIAGTGYGEGNGYNSALRFGNSGFITTLTGTVMLAGNATLVANSGGGGVLDGAIGETAQSSLTFGDKGGSYTSNGAITLNGINTYTGGTVVKYGTVTLGSPGRILVTNAGGVTIASGASMVVNGTLKLTSDLATIANAGTLTLGAGSVLDIGSYFNGQADGGTHQVVTGTAATGVFGSIVWDHAAFSNVTYSGGTLTFTAVPEPATYGLLGAGALAGMAGVRRRRRRIA